MLHLIPAPLYDFEIAQIAMDVKNQAVTINHYFVENIRTARRVLKAYDKSVEIDAITFIKLDDPSAIATLKRWNSEGVEMGIMSEAGMPAIADPGSLIVSEAQKLGIKIKPYAGPSSIILSLISSGFNGQQFSFLGYLPINAAERNAAINQAENEVILKNITQIFIETPYRNNQMMEALIKNLNNHTMLCVAANITAPNESIISRKISEWKNEKIDYHKQPAIFLIGKNQ